MSNLPNGWNETTLGKACLKIGSGATPRGGNEAYKKKGISLIRSQNILDFDFSYRGLAFIDEQQASKLNNVKIFINDILINITGDSVARVCKVPDEVLPARVNQHVAILRVNNEELNSDYLKYYLLNPSLKRHLLGLANSGGTRNALTKGSLESLDLILPPLLEQKAIAGILSSFDKKIELLREQNETLENIAQTIFKEWFVNFKKGKPISISKLIEFNPIEKIDREKEYLFFDMKTLSTNSMATSEGVFKKSNSGTSFRRGDTLFAKITPCLENGKTAFVLDIKGETVARGSTEFIVMRAKEEGSQYLNYCICRDNNFRDYAIKSMTGTSGRQRVPVDRLKTYKIQYSIDNIYKFNDIIKPMFEKIKDNTSQIQTLSKTRDALLPKLMSGEIQAEGFGL